MRIKQGVDRMTKTVTTILVMAAIAGLAPVSAHAFGLGKLELSSALNEPLRAEVLITALKDNEVENLQVRLASSKEFEQAGIERNYSLTQLEFEVIEQSDIVKIIITSQQPIREPFIDFLLTATTTGSGRLIREYTVLLDPPKNIFNKPVETMVNNSEAVSENSFQEQTSAFTTTPAYIDSYGPTVRKDTLWDVALKTRPEKSITVHQMMIALLEANPRAFQNDNVNGLKAGYTLSVPVKENIYKITKQQAVERVNKQNTLWRNRNTGAGVSPEIAQETVETDTEGTTSNLVTEPVSSNVSMTTDASARLKLVAPNDQLLLSDEPLSPLGSQTVKELSEQLTLAQETIEGQKQDSIDFKARMDVMEEQMNTMRRLIELKDADLARLQNMLEQNQQPEIINDDAAINNQLLDVMPMDDVSSVEKWQALIGTNSTIENVTEQEAAELSDAEVNALTTIESANEIEPEVVAILSTEDRATGVPQSQTQQILTAGKDLVIKNIMLAEDYIGKNKSQSLTAAGSLLLLLLGLLFVKRRKTISDVADIPEEQEGSNDKDSEIQLPVASAETVASISDVEPNFETVDSSFEKTEKLAADSDIEKPLKELDLVSDQHVTTDDTRLETTASLSSDQVSDANTSQQPTEEQEAIEFNLDDYRSEDFVIEDASTSEINDSADELSEPFSLDITDEDTNGQLSIESGSEDSILSLDEQSLTLDDDTLTTVPDLDTGSDNDGFEFDLDGYDEIDEAETKLDLASAYADMGDPDGARSILEEVLNEGNDEQKVKAQSLLDNLS